MGVHKGQLNARVLLGGNSVGVATLFPASITGKKECRGTLFLASITGKKECRGTLFLAS